ncbi:hypothetical protein HBI64_042260 [Parastagonospora nodorum]|nr:hypothetical protein HBI69_246330 [Parastagonospora nodorum]KAH6138535.1 hypothetical protein HBI64_042260 [Parastagonospora nodorum]KAH6404027.1 hypothetical protein HBI60_056690 [Parastagonospora nodorum]
MLILILSKIFSIALFTKLAILNNANIILQKLEKNYFKIRIIDILIIMLIKNNDNLLGTINSYIKSSLKRYKTKIVDSRYIKVSRERTKKNKDLENSNTSSNVLRLYRRDRLKKTRDKEKLAKAKKEKKKKEA